MLQKTTKSGVGKSNGQIPLAFAISFLYLLYANVSCWFYKKEEENKEWDMFVEHERLRQETETYIGTNVQTL